MRGAILLGPEQIEIRDLPMPRPGDGELILRVGAATTCGTGDCADLRRSSSSSSCCMRCRSLAHFSWQRSASYICVRSAVDAASRSFAKLQN